MGGHAEASSHSKLPLILVHKEFCSSPPPYSLKYFKSRNLGRLHVFYSIHKWFIPYGQDNKLDRASDVLSQILCHLILTTTLSILLTYVEMAGRENKWLAQNHTESMWPKQDWWLHPLILQGSLHTSGKVKTLINYLNASKYTVAWSHTDTV